MQGRGLVLFDTQIGVEQRDQSSNHPPFEYMSPSQLHVKDPSVVRMVDDYDPRTEMLVHFPKHGGRGSTYRLKLDTAFLRTADEDQIEF